MKHENGEIVIIGIYVDDIVIAGSSMEYINKIKRSLMDRFVITDLGDVNYLLKMEFKRIHDILVRFKTYC